MAHIFKLLREDITVWLVLRLTRLDHNKQENMLLFVCSKATESKPVKLETGRTVILPLINYLSECSLDETLFILELKSL